ncbi:mitochondrial fission factor-like isoform X3 [Pimephales promelas]|uniref:mitochondrial fission factor-like isoform X3 n=1 Tax=Pimephales promelas TaxID=90988 RepID=UPI001955DCD4|nr:mitochondrial fission factor-like isoform X3 [Pimephales promelas]KAG1970071.1 mitochondrial fission factor isoform e [Pimephales promelas]
MKVTLVMDLPGYFGDGPAAMRERDFTEAISLRMRVPERLRVGPARHAHEPEDLSAAYSMHIPDRLALTDAPDMSPRPLFSKHASSSWDLHRASWDRDAFTREPVQSPLRRSYSDQGFGRTPPGTPTHSRQTLRSQSPFGYPENHPSQAAEVQPDQSRTSASQEFWLSPDEDTGTAVELMVLRRQVVKMSRRVAGLERQNTERRQTELLLFSLLLSACLINGWLWMRR